MKREIIVIGDIEIGAGNLTDDFISDEALSKLILQFSKRNNPVDFILNGDTFDFLKCPYIKDGKVSYPRHITKEISLSKINLMYEAHMKVFEALKKFVSKKDNNLYFIIGNHDPDLFYRDVQREIKEYLGNKKNIFFKLRYRFHRIHVEHGHQYDLFNRINLDKLFLSHKGVSILNVSWVSFGIISDFLFLKEEHPFMERIKPWPLMMTKYPLVLRKLNWKSFEFLIKTLLYHPFRYYSDPTYTLPRTILRNIYYRLKNFDWEVDDVINSFKKKKKKFINHSKIYVFGHVHNKYLEVNNDFVIIQPDSWRDEYILDPETKKLTCKKKYYVHIKVNGENDQDIEWDLVHFPIKRSKFHFDDVIKNEIKSLEMAAKEESYKIPVQFT